MSERVDDPKIDIYVVTRALDMSCVAAKAYLNRQMARIESNRRNELDKKVFFEVHRVSLVLDRGLIFGSSGALKKLVISDNLGEGRWLLLPLDD